MELSGLTEFLVKSVSKNPDMVSVKEFNNDDEIIIEVLVSKDDIASIIGKGGVMINSIRNIVNLASYNQGNKSVKINIDAF